MCLRVINKQAYLKEHQPPWQDPDRVVPDMHFVMKLFGMFADGQEERMGIGPVEWLNTFDYWMGDFKGFLESKLPQGWLNEDPQQRRQQLGAIARKMRSMLESENMSRRGHTETSNWLYHF
jgi:hypothetical protein